ncbi:MAG: sulfotransferase [Myxococcota bacterium]
MAEQSQERLKLIYLMGAGHIGSTVIDVVLGTHPRIESMGELWKLPQAWLKGSPRSCACGASVHDCAFWSQVRKGWAELAGDDDVARHVVLTQCFEASPAGWARLLGARAARGDFAEYVRRNTALYRAIQQVGGKPFVVESSLSPRRAFVLAHSPGIDLHLIHLVRDGRGVIWSHQNPAKRGERTSFEPKSTFHTTKYWVTANLQSTLVFSRVRAERRLRLRYEDFATEPHAFLARLGAWIGEDLSGLLSAARATAEAAPVRHTPGGNRVRLQKQIHVRADFGWIEHLPERERRLFWLLAGWLARGYGYGREPSAAAAPGRS